MKAPQIITLVLMGVALLWAAYRHGKPREGRDNFWVAAAVCALWMGIYVWGGFFSGGAR